LLSLPSLLLSMILHLCNALCKGLPVSLETEGKGLPVSLETEGKGTLLVQTGQCVG